MNEIVVPFHDLRPRNASADLAEIESVLASGRLILGRSVQHFEEQWAAECGVDFSVGVGNGLDAIEIGLRALGIGQGDEVVTTPMTAVATILGILRAGATPVLAEIDSGTGLITPESAARCITASTRAVLVVHLYGQMANMHAWKEFTDTFNVLLIEDCAQSHGSSFSGRRAGSWGEFGAFSFYPTKNLGAIGDAGALVTSSSCLALKAKELRNYGQSNRYEHPLLGLNSRLDELQAAILSRRLPDLAALTRRRQKIAERFRAEINSPRVSLLDAPIDQSSHVYHLFVVLADNREALQGHLLERGVSTLIHYPIPAHNQDSLRGIRIDPAGLKNAENHALHCLSLPCAPHLTDAQVQHVIDSVNSFR